MTGFTLPRHPDIAIGGGGQLLIAGPCVMESAEETIAVAERVAAICSLLGLPFVFKASFDKANRTSGESFRGPGLEAGLEILAAIAGKGLAVTTDIHLPSQAELVARVVDIIQIPAFLCRQTDLVESAASTGRVVNIKKGQFMAPEQMGPVVDKAVAAGAGGVMVTERGTFFGYGDLVVDMRSLVILRGMGIPVIYDATHSVQRPGGEGSCSGGRSEFTRPLACAAAAAGVDGFFVETHPEPARAKSDRAVQLPLGELEGLLRQVLLFSGRGGEPR